MATYAHTLVPILHRSRKAFDDAALGIRAPTDASELISMCDWFSQQVLILAEQVDGLPYSGSWYGKVANFHHQVVSVYHDMSGALQECRLGATNADEETIAASKTDILAADRHLRSIDDYTRWLTTHV
ncbi:MAG: hypothetical protein NVSMB52_12140 [Chloroflexota bacterium]